jgi:hypothetical protein
MLVGKACIAQLDLKTCDAFKIKLGPKQIRLVPVGAADEEARAVEVPAGSPADTAVGQGYQMGRDLDPGGASLEPGNPSVSVQRPGHWSAAFHP